MSSSSLSNNHLYGSTSFKTNVSQKKIIEIFGGLKYDTYKRLIKLIEDIKKNTQTDEIIQYIDEETVRDCDIDNNDIMPVMVALQKFRSVKEFEQSLFKYLIINFCNDDYSFGIIPAKCLNGYYEIYKILTKIGFDFIKYRSYSNDIVKFIRIISHLIFSFTKIIGCNVMVKVKDALEYFRKMQLEAYDHFNDNNDDNDDNDSDDRDIILRNSQIINSFYSNILTYLAKGQDILTGPETIYNDIKLCDYSDYYILQKAFAIFHIQICNIFKS